VRSAASTARGLTLSLLDKTDTLLGVILLGNNLINAGAATIAAGHHRAHAG
jgi:Mg2+/Co2+ transporter CorB